MACRPGDLRARAVGDAQVERQRASRRGALHDAVHRLSRGGREPLEVAQRPHRHAPRAQVVHLAGDILLEQPHQRVHLEGGPLPVLLAEGEEGEHAHAGIQRALDHLPHRAHAGVVAQRPRQRPAAGPTAVAVHDDRDVGRDGAVDLQLPQQFVAHAITLP